MNVNTNKCTGGYGVGRVIRGVNDLTITHPELVENEWDFEKNSSLNIHPYMVSRGSHSFKVWWKCERGHSYDCTVNHRTSVNFPRGCPYCSNTGSSFPEQFIFSYIKQVFADATNGEKLHGYKFDIYIKSENTVLEYDSEYYHSELVNRVGTDELKDKICFENSIRVIRVIEDKTIDEIYTDIEKDRVYYKGTANMGEQIEALKSICDIILELLGKQTSDCSIDIEKAKQEAQKYIKHCRIEKSLGHNYTELLKEWDTISNEGIDPYKISQKSGRKVNWICSIDPSHKWESTVHNRTLHKSGCPRCMGIMEDNSIKAKYPELFVELNQEINIHVDIDSITITSPESLIWNCSGCGHVWDAKVASRVYQQSGCRKCKWNCFTQSYKNKKTQQIISIPKAPWQT